MVDDVPRDLKGFAEWMIPRVVQATVDYLALRERDPLMAEELQRLSEEIRQMREKMREMPDG